MSVTPDGPEHPWAPRLAALGAVTVAIAFLALPVDRALARGHGDQFSVNTNQPLGPVSRCRQATGNAHQAHWIVETSAAQCEAEKARLQDLPEPARGKNLECWTHLDAALREIRAARPIFDEAKRTLQPAQNTLVRDGNRHLQLAGEAIERADQCIKAATRDIFSAGTTGSPPGPRPGPAPSAPGGSGWRVEEYSQTERLIPRPSLTAPQGTVTQHLKWNELIKESGRNVRRQGECTVKLNFTADGNLTVAVFRYRNTDTSTPFPNRTDIEEISGNFAARPQPWDLRITPKTRDRVLIQFTNPWFETISVNRRITMFGGAVVPQPDTPGQNYRVHCLVRTLRDVELKGKLGPVEVPVLTSADGQTLQKPIPRATLTMSWSFNQ